MRSTKPMTVTLGEIQERVDDRVRSGAYASVGEVLRAGLLALESEEATLDAVLRRTVPDALDDPIPANQVFADLRAHHARRVKAYRSGA